MFLDLILLSCQLLSGFPDSLLQFLILRFLRFHKIL